MDRENFNEAEVLYREELYWYQTGFTMKDRGKIRYSFNESGDYDVNWILE